MKAVKIQEETIKNPITFIGKQAGFAYASDTTDDKKNYKRGLQCIKDGHFRLLEFCDIYFTLEGYSNRMVRELFRHVGDGLTAIQESTRYVDFSKGFDYVIPETVMKKGLNYVKVYKETMEVIQKNIQYLMDNEVPKEDAQMLVPLGATTKVAMKKNMRNLMEMSRVRMCNRAYWEFRQFMNDLKGALSNYNPEWKELCNILMYAKCEPTKTCNEKFTCGKYPKKEQ